MVDLDQVAWGGGFHAVQPGFGVFFKDAFAFGAQGREVFVNFFYAQINGDDTIFQFHRGLLRQSFKPLYGTTFLTFTESLQKELRIE
jgi:hypothetical protein